MNTRYRPTGWLPAHGCRSVFKFALMLMASTALLHAEAQPGKLYSEVLEQATFGPNTGIIDRVRAIGFSAFLYEQFALTASTYPTFRFNAFIKS